MSSDEEGGGGGGAAPEPNQRAGNIEGALTAKGDGQILKGRMEAERVRKQDEMARAALRKAALAADLAEQKTDVTYTRALGRAGSRSDAFDAPVERAPPREKKAAEQKEWVYIDAKKAQQGPFTLTQMQQWYAAGYLPDSTEVKHEDDAAFTTVGQQSRIYVAASVGVSAPRQQRQQQQPMRQQPMRQQQPAFQQCNHQAFTPGCPCCTAYAPPQQQQQRAGYSGYTGYQQQQQQAGAPQSAQAAHAASVAREMAGLHTGPGGGPAAAAAAAGADAPGVAGGGVKKKKKKDKVGNAVPSRAMPSFKAARSTKDMWSGASSAGINLF